MTTTATPTRPTDPLSRPVGSWTATLAALKSRGADETDPRIVECREALAYYRLTRAIDAERGVQLSPRLANRLARRLRELAQVAS